MRTAVYLMTINFRFCLLIVFCFPILANAELKTVTVAGANWPGFVNLDGTGIYLEPIRSAFQQTSVIKWDITEFERARRLFLAQRADILVGVYRTTYPDKLYPSKPIDIENELRAYFMPDTLSIKTIADLDNKVIAWRHGYEFEGLLHHYTTHIPYDDTTRAFALLASGKLDVVLDYVHNVPPEFQNKVDSIVVLPKETLWIVFHNTAKGQALLREYEAAVK